MAVAVREQQRTRLWLTGCLLLALLLRTPYLSVALGRDEGGLAFIARQWPGGHGSLYGAYWLDRPPLLVAVFKVAALGGAVGVRLLGAAAALALVAAIARLGCAVAGPRAGLIAGLLAALLSGSVALGAVFTPAELLAAVPSTLSLLCLVRVHSGAPLRWLAAAGALAVAAALVKQSFLDAGVAGLAFLAVSARRDRALAYAAGAASPLAALMAWQLGHGGVLYALVGFRLDALGTLSGSNLPLHTRLLGLAVPALASGLVVAVALAVAGLRRLRGDRVLVVTLSAWLAAAILGVLAGGSYWPHYLIELVPVSCIGAAVALDDARLRSAVLGTWAAIAVLAAAGGAIYVTARPPYRAEQAVGRYVRAHARAGDTAYVMYARANVTYYAGLPSPYPYAWSLMVRAVPGARARLQRLLASPRRPTWVVEWQPPGRWGLDPGGRTARLLARGYRVAARVRGHRIYERSDR